MYKTLLPSTNFWSIYESTSSNNPHHTAEWTPDGKASWHRCHEESRPHINWLRMLNIGDQDLMQRLWMIAKNSNHQRKPRLSYTRHVINHTQRSAWCRGYWDGEALMKKHACWVGSTTKHRSRGHAWDGHSSTARDSAGCDGLRASVHLELWQRSSRRSENSPRACETCTRNSNFSGQGSGSIRKHAILSNMHVRTHAVLSKCPSEITDGDQVDCCSLWRADSTNYIHRYYASYHVYNII